MTKEQAVAEAAKREKHKSKHLAMVWQARHDSVRGWHVALVKPSYLVAAEAIDDARTAIMNDDAKAFTNAAERLLLARCDMTVAAALGTAA